MDERVGLPKKIRWTVNRLLRELPKSFTKTSDAVPATQAAKSLSHRTRQAVETVRQETF
jgi:hypothetical protein